MKMNRENRWVKRAEIIPWAEIEVRYAALFKNKKGNVAKPLRLALGACLIQADQDTELLNQARECTEKLIDEIHNPAEGKKPRTYREQARKDYPGRV